MTNRQEFRENRLIATSFVLYALLTVSEVNFLKEHQLLHLGVSIAAFLAASALIAGVFIHLKSPSEKVSYTKFQAISATATAILLPSSIALLLVSDIYNSFHWYFSLFCAWFVKDCILDAVISVSAVKNEKSQLPT